MIFGRYEIKNGNFRAHRNTYIKLENFTVAIDPQFRAPSFCFAAAILFFSWSFFDILHAEEIRTLIGIAIVLALFGWRFGRIQIINRDLKNTQQSCALYGTLGSLERVRSEIEEKFSPTKEIEVD